MTIRRRHKQPLARPFFSMDDVWLLIELPLLFVLCSLVPEQKWAATSLKLEALKIRVGRVSLNSILSGMRLVGRRDVVQSSALEVTATRTEHHLQVLRDFFWGWSSDVTLVGAHHIAEALSKQRGAVLWVAHMSFNALAVKKALHAESIAVSHLSRPEHGFSKSLFGISFFNVIRSKTESRYLRQRIIIDRKNPMVATHRALRELQRNQIISITAGAWEGSRVATVNVGENAELDLATGAPGLAFLTGAALLPVYAVQQQRSTKIIVTVDKPILLDRSRDRDLEVMASAQTFMDRMAMIIADYPAQWRDWDKIRQRESST
jgi:hypothetical protein